MLQFEIKQSYITLNNIKILKNNKHNINIH